MMKYISPVLFVLLVYMSGSAFAQQSYNKVDSFVKNTATLYGFRSDTSLSACLGFICKVDTSIKNSKDVMKFCDKMVDMSLWKVLTKSDDPSEVMRAYTGYVMWPITLKEADSPEKGKILYTNVCKPAWDMLLTPSSNSD